MYWFVDYWWVVLIIFVGMILNGIKELCCFDYKKFLSNKLEILFYCDNNVQWDDDDDWLDKDKKK